MSTPTKYSNVYKIIVKWWLNWHIFFHVFLFFLEGWVTIWRAQVFFMFFYFFWRGGLPYDGSALKPMVLWYHNWRGLPTICQLFWCLPMKCCSWPTIIYLIIGVWTPIHVNGHAQKDGNACHDYVAKILPPCLFLVFYVWVWYNIASIKSH